MDKNSEGVDAVVGAVGSEGEQRSSLLSTARDDRLVAPLAPGQRWSLARKRDVVLRGVDFRDLEFDGARLFNVDTKNAPFADAHRRHPCAKTGGSVVDTVLETATGQRVQDQCSAGRVEHTTRNPTSS